MRFQVVSSLVLTYTTDSKRIHSKHALQIVKSAFWNGIINIGDEVAAHVAAEWDFGGLVDAEESSEPV